METLDLDFAVRRAPPRGRASGPLAEHVEGFSPAGNGRTGLENGQLNWIAGFIRLIVDDVLGDTEGAP